MLILKSFRERNKHSPEALWQLRFKHWLSVSTSTSDYGLAALRLRRRRTALANNKHRAQLLKLDFSRRISNLVSDEIVDKFPPIFEVLRVLFG